ncbi:MFS transporter [Niveispirillum irakense]|uniref:MFS transporter n=1 Tax=Niveispirillum irakense TaxID=34011 RepID=UPI0003F658ED|nr:MFS transporter [Niveispirillum irakense]
MDRAEEFRRGWRLVLAAATGVGLGITGLTFYTLGIFIGPLSQEFGWSRTALASATILTTLTTLLLGPVVGRLADRFGGRRVGLVSLIGLALGLGGLSLIGADLWSFYLAFGIAMVLGAGTLPIVWTRAVNAGFDKARGLALGLTLTGTGVCAILAPPFTQWLIAEHGWRTAYLGQAVLVLVIGLPMVWLLFHEVGGNSAAAPDRPKVAQPGFTAAQARRTRQFWMLGIGFLFASFAVSALIVHLVSILTGGGLARESAVWAASLLGFAIIAGRLGIGVLVDRFYAPLVAFSILVVAGVACLLLLVPGGGLPLALLCVVLIGLAAGAEVDLVAYLASRYFGMRAYGEIYGWQLGFFALGAGLGPMGVGRLYDATGSYLVGLLAAAIGFIVGAVLIGLLGRYPERFSD